MIASTNVAQSANIAGQLVTLVKIMTIKMMVKISGVRKIKDVILIGHRLSKGRGFTGDTDDEVAFGF